MDSGSGDRDGGVTGATGVTSVSGGGVRLSFIIGSVSLEAEAVVVVIVSEETVSGDEGGVISVSGLTEAAYLSRIS